VAIVGMLVHGSLAAEIADVLGLTETSLDARRWAILKRLTDPTGRPDAPTATVRAAARLPLAHQSPARAP